MSDVTGGSIGDSPESTGRDGPGIWQPELDELARRESMVEQMGGPEKVARQHDRGKMDVRQRIESLVDHGSFHEIGKVSGSATYDADGTS